MGIVSEDARYPIGKFVAPESSSPEQRRDWIRNIAECPTGMREAVAGLTEAQLDTPYREGGWTVRQVVHHVPDSHAHAYIRMKLALTEDEPLIKPYDENKWAQLPDATAAPPEMSLRFLAALHGRWVAFLEAMTEADFARIFWHPEYPDGPLRLDVVLAMYAWHSRHHVAHIRALRDRMHW